MASSIESISADCTGAYVWLSAVVRLDGREESKAALDCLWNALETQAPPAAVPVHVSTLRWWRELAQINPDDLVPRIDAMLAAAREGE